MPKSVRINPNHLISEKPTFQAFANQEPRAAAFARRLAELLLCEPLDKVDLPEEMSTEHNPVSWVIEKGTNQSRLRVERLLGENENVEVVLTHQPDQGITIFLCIAGTWKKGHCDWPAYGYRMTLDVNLNIRRTHDFLS